MAKIKTLGNAGGGPPLRKSQALQALLEGRLAACRENARLKWLPVAPRETALSLRRSLVSSGALTALAVPGPGSLGGFRSPSGSHAPYFRRGSGAGPAGGSLHARSCQGPPGPLRLTKPGLKSGTRGAGGGGAWRKGGGRSRGPPAARLGSRRSRPLAPGTAVPAPRRRRSQVLCCQIRPCQVRPHRAPSTSLSQNLTVTWRPTLYPLVRCQAGLPSAWLCDHPSCLASVLSRSSSRTPGPVHDPQPRQALGLQYWGVLEESERNSFFPSPSGGPGRARLGSPLSAPRGPWMTRQQRSRGAPRHRRVHPADTAQLALLPSGGGGSPRSTQ